MHANTDGKAKQATVSKATVSKELRGHRASSAGRREALRCILPSTYMRASSAGRREALCRPIYGRARHHLASLWSMTIGW